MNKEMIIVLDFGGQYNLVARQDQGNESKGNHFHGWSK